MQLEVYVTRACAAPVCVCVQRTLCLATTASLCCTCFGCFETGMFILVVLIYV
jgi:hypothetical protein